MKRKRHIEWVLLYKKEGAQKVWLYEQLRKKEISIKLRQGWEIC